MTTFYKPILQGLWTNIVASKRKLTVWEIF